MVSFRKKLSALLWKSVLVRFRNLVISGLELAILILGGCILFSAMTQYGYGETDADSSQRHFKIKTPFLAYASLLTAQIVYTPINNVTEEIMTNLFVNSIFHREDAVNVPLSMENETVMEEWLEKKSSKNSRFSKYMSAHVIIGIVFGKTNKSSKRFHYKIRSSSPYIRWKESSRYIFNDNYEGSEFIRLQLHLDREILRFLGATVQDNAIYFGPLPKPMSSTLLQFQGLYLYLMFSYTVIVVSFVKEILLEKRAMITDHMKVCGISARLIWLNWLFYIIMLHLPASLVLIVGLSCCIPANHLDELFIVWMSFLMYTINVVILVFVGSWFFHNPTIGTTGFTCGWITLHVISIMFFPIFNQLPIIGQFIFCFLPLNNFTWVVHSLSSSYGLWKVSDILLPTFEYSPISIGVSMIIFILEIVFLTLVLAVLDWVWPLSHGAKPITCNLPIPLLSRKRTDATIIQCGNLRRSVPINFEQQTKSKTPTIEVKNCHVKIGVFSKKIPIQSLDLVIYEKEILVLLGQNGAGKTTGLSLIAGVYPPSSGGVLFNGKNIYSSSINVNYREYIGFCPQNSVCFPKLTVFEHLQFFGMISGLSFSEAKVKCLELLVLLNMSYQKDAMIEQLPGGLKRKVNLAMALIGNPSVLILDEPTSGIDVQSKHELWNIILKMRGQRTVIISTHVIEEADVLGDRVAILDHGVIICCGTVMFLKTVFDVGYHVIINSEQKYFTEINDVVQQYLNGHRIDIVSRTKMRILVSKTSVDQFPVLFEALEQRSLELKITGMSVFCRTLEDVFMKLGEEASAKDSIEPLIFMERRNINENKVDDCLVRCRHVVIAFWKCFLLRYKHYLILASFPCLIILVMSICTKMYVDSLKVQSNPRPVTVGLQLYPHSVIPIIYDDSGRKIADIATKFIHRSKSKVVFLNNTSITDYIIKTNTEDVRKYFQTLLSLQFVENKVIVQYLGVAHVTPVAANLISNLLLLNSTNITDGEIELISEPFVFKGKHNNYNIVDTITIEETVSVIWFFFFIVGLSCLMAMYLPSITIERTSGFKLQQNIAGVSHQVFWAVNLTFDYLWYLLVIIVFVSIISVFSGDLVLFPFFFETLIFILALYGLSGLLFVYLFSYFIDNIILAFCVYIVFEVVLTTSSLLVLYRTMSATIMLFVVLGLLSFNPLFAASMAIYKLIFAATTIYTCKVFRKMHQCDDLGNLVMSIKTKENRWGLVIYVVFLFFYWLIYFILIILLDQGVLRKLLLTFRNTWRPPFLQLCEDIDVTEERKVVSSLKEEDNTTVPLRVEGLTKMYYMGPRAVDNISFMVTSGECFGILGASGAGKTTVLQMLATDIYPNEGDVQIFKFNMCDNKPKYMHCIGYCPQSRGFCESLTPHEVLKIIGLQRGIDCKNICKEVSIWLKILGISNIAKRPCLEFSSATRKKISIAMAFIGDPIVVMLDEPTVGMDPLSRRRIWNLIESRKKTGQVVVMTSQNLVECQTLCTRLTVLKEGKMKCIGTMDHLNKKFSRGYTVHVKLTNPTPNQLGNFKQDFAYTFYRCVLIDENVNLIHYQIRDSRLALSKLFTDLLRIQYAYSIVEDITVSNTSLDYLFLKFTKTSLIGQSIRSSNARRRSSLYQEERRITLF